MPIENPPTRRLAAAVSPTSSSSSSARSAPMPQVWPSTRRWLRALRPGWKLLASSAAPTTRCGWVESAYRWPPMVAVPDVGVTSESSIRSVVVLPAPFGPRKPVIRPGSTVKVRSWTATTLPKCLVRPLTSIRLPWCDESLTATHPGAQRRQAAIVRTLRRRRRRGPADQPGGGRGAGRAAPPASCSRPRSRPPRCVPPCSSTAQRAIARPSPVPPVTDCAAPARWKRSKTRSRSRRGDAGALVARPRGRPRPVGTASGRR